MDDTIILATSKEQMLYKLQTLKHCIDDIGMTMNPAKSQFMSINDETVTSFQVDDVVIARTGCYEYLGTPVMMAPISEQVKTHLSRKFGNVCKFISFLKKNSDAPFQVKKKVWESALCSSIFYSCETWFTKDLKAAESVYYSTLKSLLSVRSTTCNDLTLVESGETGAISYILRQQSNFLNKLQKRDNYQGSYIQWIINEAIQSQCPSGRVLQSILGSNSETFISQIEKAQQSILTSQGSRRANYRSINPRLDVNAVYSANVPEYERISFTRMRLSSHRLHYETGRWSRIAPENRRCPCGDVQTKKHVLLDCPLSEGFREQSNISVNTITELFDDENAVKASKLCHLILSSKAYI